VPKPFPPEFRRDVIAVARRGEASIAWRYSAVSSAATMPSRWRTATGGLRHLRPTVLTTDGADGCGGQVQSTRRWGADVAVVTQTAVVA
jgi:transposase